MSSTASISPNASDSIVRVRGLSKIYAGGFQALKNVNLDIRRGEIFALLGPNGAGKTTLISVICGMSNATTGTVTADGHDTVNDYRAARAAIGLVPQELHTDSFETVWATVSFSRGLFGKPSNPALIEKILKDLSLWDKKDNKIMTLSGGMKRRVLIAKALSHEPKILFLDEPSAGVDVELRHDMWRLVPPAAGRRHHHHPDHALHRGGRGHGRPHRRDQQGRADRGGRQGRADAQARQEAAHAHPAATHGACARCACPLAAGAGQARPGTHLHL
jgi:ABC-type Mn2+/Zn2+ transport system ATPase subunit